jgi:predicted RNase H-related nuclease YkuK (DUF458 family)
MDDPNGIDTKSEVSNQKFLSDTHGVLNLDQVMGTIAEFIDLSPNADYLLAVGSDSDIKNKDHDGSKYLHVVTALLIYRFGYGGKYFRNYENLENIHSLREKIYAETMKSLNFAMFLKPVFKKALNGNSEKLNFEIHVDIGEKGKTKDMLAEITGMIKGVGFEVKTKPNAYAATKVADRHT